eukprot:jgi/Tetstr1/459355/TSEL_000424.t1
MAGRCHSRTAAFLASGTVYALHKDDPAAREEQGKSGEPLRVRPLSVGSALVRLASAHALGQAGADAREVMGPVQRSFQSGAGCETAYMSMRVALQLFGGRGTGGKGLLLLDIRNAFDEISRATNRVSTQLQNLESEVKYLLKKATASEEAERCWRGVVNMQKEVEKELRSQLAAEERARVEADILRRKLDKKGARLKTKIRLMFESNGSEAESIGSEGIGNDEEGGGQKPGRERPAGMSYKLREATIRATMRKFIGRKAEQLEAWLTDTTTTGNLCMRRAGPAHSSEPLPAVTKERSSSSSSSSSMAMSTRMELTGRRRASRRRRT